MSNRDPDLTYDEWPQALKLMGRELLRQVHTALPGFVLDVMEDHTRVKVQPAVTLMLSDGTHMPRAALVDVPVLHPRGGIYSIRLPVNVGDAVLLAFSERDISGFKTTLASGRLPSDRIMATQDAVAIPGLLPYHPASGQYAPATATGLSIQTDDGETAIVVEEGTIRLKADTVAIEYDGGTQQWP